MLIWSLLFVLGACPRGPAAAEVLQRVDALRGPGRPVVPWKLSFSSRGDEVALSATADGETFERALPADADCAALAEATAVVLLLLESDLAEAARTRTVHRPQPASVAVRPPESVEAPPSFDIGLGQGVTVAWPSMPWEFVVRGVWRPPAARLGLGAHMRYHAPASKTSVPLEVGWTRLEGRIGPDFSLLAGPVEVAFAAEASSGVLWLSGTSALGSANFTTWDLGGAASVRASPTRAGLRVWLELSLVAWARQHRVIIQGTGYVAALPVIEADLVLGVSWGR